MGYPAFLYPYIPPDLPRIIVVDMVYCPKCGKELPVDAVFCDKCGQKMDEPVSLFEERWKHKYERRLERFERSDRGSDYLDGVGFGVFLIAIAWVYLQYTWVWEEIVVWFRSWVNGPTMLPLILTEPIFLFFVIMSVWGLVEGALRMVSGRVAKGLGNVIGAVGGFAVAYLIRLYGQGAISGASLLPSFIIIIGASIVLSAIVSSFLWSSPRRD
jgi:hypothetical protein